MAYDAIRWAGCAYLVYLAFKTIRSDATPFAPTTELKRFSMQRILGEGLLTNLLNPKMALFVLALFPQFVAPQTGLLPLQMLVLATVLNVTGLVVNGTVILLSGHIRSRFAGRNRFNKLPQYLLATVFAGLACRLALGSRN
jgi:threonine/homoserine/homoserine lactone efflux protein